MKIKNGFTLMEMLVTVFIISILTGMAMVGYRTFILRVRCLDGEYFCDHKKKCDAFVSDLERRESDCSCCFSEKYFCRNQVSCLRSYPPQSSYTPKFTCPPDVKQERVFVCS